MTKGYSRGSTLDFLFFLLNGNELILAAHIRSEGNGDIDGTVGIKVILKESDKHSGRSNNRIVEGMGKIFAILTVNSDFKASCLGIAEI